jgi:hypothetical protein
MTGNLHPTGLYNLRKRTDNWILTIEKFIRFTTGVRLRSQANHLDEVPGNGKRRPEVKLVALPKIEIRDFRLGGIKRT